MVMRITAPIKPQPGASANAAAPSPALCITPSLPHSPYLRIDPSFSPSSFRLTLYNPSTHYPPSHIIHPLIRALAPLYHKPSPSLPTYQPPSIPASSPPSLPPSCRSGSTRTGVRPATYALGGHAPLATTPPTTAGACLTTGSTMREAGSTQGWIG